MKFFSAAAIVAAAASSVNGATFVGANAAVCYSGPSSTSAVVTVLGPHVEVGLTCRRLISSLVDNIVGTVQNTNVWVRTNRGCFINASALAVTNLLELPLCL